MHGVKALKQMGIPSVVVNNNPETVSTDYATADRLYFEPLTADDVVAIAQKEQVRGVLLQYGGQTAVKLVAELEAAGLPVLGTCREAIDIVEDRDRFYTLLQQLGIPHIPVWQCRTITCCLKRLNSSATPSCCVRRTSLAVKACTSCTLPNS